jgi:CBS-domain-containing membrane protein
MRILDAVIDPERHLVGIITQSDLARALCRGERCRMCANPMENRNTGVSSSMAMKKCCFARRLPA